MSAPILNDDHPVHQLMLQTLSKRSGLLATGTIVHPLIGARFRCASAAF